MKRKGRIRRGDDKGRSRTVHDVIPTPNKTGDNRIGGNAGEMTENF